MTERSDNDLVNSSRNGDDEAFAELWRRHAPAGLTVARSFSDADADDVVAEAYVRILQAVRDGHGPTNGFRPYLFTTIRNVAASWGRSRREDPIDDATMIEDPASTEAASMEALDRSLTVRAFRSLPERWQEVLWYCEVEQMAPATVAPLLGLSANGVAALAYRAREGLRQAWIQAHIGSSPEGSECRWTTERLGGHARNGLGKRETTRIDRHLAECTKCSIVAAEAHNVGSRLVLVLLPLLLGISGAAAYASTLSHGSAATPTAGADTGKPANGSTGAAHIVGRSTTRGTRIITGVVAATVVVAASVAGAVVLVPQLFPEPTPRSVTAASDTGSPPASAVPAQQAPSAPSTPLVPVVSPPVLPSPPTADSPPATLVDPEPDNAAPGEAPPTPTPPVPPVVRPPAAPVLSSTFPADYATAASSLPLTGTGQPGATVAILGVASHGPSPQLATLRTERTTTDPPKLGTTIVQPDGSWALTADLTPLQDGVWNLSAAQSVDGRTSPPSVNATVTIDRTALPPVVTGVDTGTDPTLLLAPILTGDAEAGATVVIQSGGTAIATVTADDTGHWSTPELITIPAGYTLTARQTDRLGNTSTDSAPVTGQGTTAGTDATGGAGTVSIQVHGLPGRRVQVWADGVPTPYLLTLDGAGDVSAVYTWSPGDHRIGVVYVVGGRHGLLADVPVALH